MQTFTIMGQRLNQHELKDADVVITPAWARWAGRLQRPQPGDPGRRAGRRRRHAALKAKLKAKQQPGIITKYNNNLEQEKEDHANQTVLTLADVKKIAAAAEAEALANKWAVVIAIVDDGGHLLWLQRLDGAAPISSTSPRPRPRPPRWAAANRRSTKT
jgi:hypothetical protein